MNIVKATLLSMVLVSCTSNQLEQQVSVPQANPSVELLEMNHQLPTGNEVVAIVGATLIDGTGAESVANATVVIKENLIWAVGPAESVSIPEDAEMIDAAGLTMLPGLIDAHFHLNNNQLPGLVLSRGTTTLRDPGAWIESYQEVRELQGPIPRLFLTGPHLDMPPPAYPKNSYLVTDEIEAEKAVNKFADQGATAIKVYFRLSPTIIEAVCSTADQRGIPVTAHLEITSATAAINAGVDGIEHITSFGIDLLPTYQAEQYRQSVLADNNARREGRYQTWSQIDLTSNKVDTLVALLRQQGTVVSPTLGAFEYRFGEGKSDTLKVTAFQNMMNFVGLLNEADIPIVTGSHSWVPYAEVGWAFQREMELLAESGLSPMEVIVASTLENARFFRIEQRLGSLEVGKQADLLLIEGDPLEDLKALYEVRRVMLNGIWIN
jgi:imidazolonepropionase-like amidohydrolase